MAETLHRTETIKFGIDMVKRGARKKKSEEEQVNFEPMLRVDIKTGTILVDKREEKYWTL